MEEHMQDLATVVAPLYKAVAPDAYRNQVIYKKFKVAVLVWTNSYYFTMFCFLSRDAQVLEYFSCSSWAFGNCSAKGVACKFRKLAFPNPSHCFHLHCLVSDVGMIGEFLFPLHLMCIICDLPSQNESQLKSVRCFNFYIF